jgi:GT2 family glycosyltransferase
MRLRWRLLDRRRPGPARSVTPPAGLAEPSPRVSIIIVTWNSLELTRQCLASVLADDTYPAPELVLVDNHSQDGTAAFLQSFAKQHPGRVKLRLNAQNEGFARACNQGRQLADGEVIVFLNNDTVVPRGWLTRLVAYLRNPQIGLVGPVTNGTGNEARIVPGYSGLDELQAYADFRATEFEGQVFDIPVLALFCAAGRREVLDQIGPLDEQFGQGLFEDDDLAMRVRRAGYRVVCAEAVYVHHWQRAGFKQLNQTAYKALFDRNQALFEAKWQQRWQPHRTRGQAGSGLPSSRFDPQRLDWRCNVCGHENNTPLAEFTREAGFCTACRSTVRRRGIVHLLSMELFGQSLPLPDFQ